MIPFNFIPQGLRTPFFVAEVNNSEANTATEQQRALIIGQVITGANGANVLNEPLPCPYVSYGAAFGGSGSQLDIMVRAYRAIDPSGELWILPIADAGGAVKATGNISFTGPATASGSLNLYLAGIFIPVPVTVGMTASQLATAVVAAVNATPGCPAAAAVDGTHSYQVDFTAVNAGLVGNDIDIQLNYLGTIGNQSTPAGITPTITAMSGGTTNPTLTSPLANLVNKAFDFIISPYTDATSLAAIGALLNDSAGRWSWNSQVYGHQFTAYRGTYGSLTTFGVTNNDQHLTCMGFYDSPSMAMAWAASIGAADAVGARADPAQPMQTVQLPGLLAPPIYSRFSKSQQETLLYDGISTFDVTAGVVAISRLITTYQLNGFDQADNSYLSIETMTTLTAVLRQLNTVISSKYARMKLASDGTPIAPGSNVVTPSTVRGDLIALYGQMCLDGLTQNPAEFAAALVVEQNASNPDRLDVLWPGVLIDQLNIFALLAQFRLS